MVKRRGGRTQEPGVIWERPEPADKPAPVPLSRDGIVATAIALADADGLPAVSLRKVATALDAGPMRLYGYISTKDELLDLMVDQVYGEAELPDESMTDWRQRLRVLAGGMRQVAGRHEWFVELLGGRPSLGPHSLARLGAITSTLDTYAEFGDVVTMAQAAATFRAYTIGALQSEIGVRRAERGTGMNREEWQHASSAYLRRALATGAYPALARFIESPSHPERSVDFEQGLEFVLDGIAARMAG